MADPFDGAKCLIFSSEDGNIKAWVLGFKDMDCSTITSRKLAIEAISKSGGKLREIIPDPHTETVTIRNDYYNVDAGTVLADMGLPPDFKKIREPWDDTPAGVREQFSVNTTGVFPKQGKLVLLRFMEQPS